MASAMGFPLIVPYANNGGKIAALFEHRNFVHSDLAQMLEFDVTLDFAFSNLDVQGLNVGRLNNCSTGIALGRPPG
jgi:hypothetical protein